MSRRDVSGEECSRVGDRTFEAGLNPDGADLNESSPVLSESEGVDMARLFWC